MCVQPSIFSVFLAPNVLLLLLISILVLYVFFYNQILLHHYLLTLVDTAGITLKNEIKVSQMVNHLVTII